MMNADRYLKLILTIIAFELMWIAAGGRTMPVSAQGPAAPVVITGIQLEGEGNNVLPVTVRGTVAVAPTGVVKIEADRPLLVESVPYTPSARPGE